MKCGLLGEKLGHSYSPELHAFFGDYDYDLFEVPPEDLGSFLKTQDFQGLNVTIPYKTTLHDLCDNLTEAARSIGSVNTVVKKPGGFLLGDNTDAAGFEGMVWKSRVRVLGRKCLVLGSGGASLAVQYVLRKLGAGEIVVISRSGPDNYENLDKHADAEVIVNTTPVGMYPNTAATPVDLRDFPRCEGVLDVIYNPARTALIQQAEVLGIPCLGGLYMLVEQARCASQVFTGRPLPAIRSKEAYSTLSSRKENRILVGMPGSGKSTVGAALAAGAPVSSAPWSLLDFRLSAQPVVEARARARAASAAARTAPVRRRRSWDSGLFTVRFSLGGYRGAVGAALRRRGRRSRRAC